MNWRPARLLGLVALFAASWLAAESLPERSARVVDYDIAVRLDPEAKEIVGSERIVWRNPSGEAVPDLWFHLYLNAFRNTDSTFYRESGGRLRRDSAFEDGWGWTDVTALRLADGTDLLPALTFEHPDDDNESDRTVARVVLPEPVAAGGEVALEVEFRARLPRVYARSGWAPEEFFLVGQWFPKLGVYEPAGMRGREAGGWNCHTYHANSEFYADYGAYRVEITAPARFVIGATGKRVERREGGDGMLIHVFEQQDVHDFAWSADPTMIESVERFSGSDDVTRAEYAEAARLLGRPLEEVVLSDVEIHLLLQPEHRSQQARYFAAAKVALKTFGLAWGRYPYATLTVVDPPTGGWGAGGMEYPTLVTGGSAYMLGLGPMRRVRVVETVTVHEIGHNWWYGLVGSNEFEEAWLDEGFTQFAEEMAMSSWGAAAFVDLPWLRVGPFSLGHAANRLDRRYDSMRTPAWGFSRGQYGFYSYAKTALTLETLRGLLGDETFARALRTYAERWRFRHPSSDDFYAVVEEVSERDLGDFFGQVVEGRGAFDPAVVRVSSERERSMRGHPVDGDLPPDSPGGLAEEAADDDGGADDDDEAEETSDWRSVIELRQLGEVRLPVEVELRFEGRDPERRTWNGDELWARWELVEPARLLEVVVDPDNVYALDVSRFNNRLATDSDARPALRTTVLLLFWLQQLLAGVGL